MNVQSDEVQCLVYLLLRSGLNRATGAMISKGFLLTPTRIDLIKTEEKIGE
jgi:hypothetical protein